MKRYQMKEKHGEQRVMDCVSINIDERSITSIRLAEKSKLELENNGYTLINHFGGMFNSTMIYGKPLFIS